MDCRCPQAEFVGIAKLRGYRFLINSRGVATIVSDDSHTVHGVLWSITKEDEEALDKCEGVKYDTYRKEKMDIESAAGSVVCALVYVASDSTPGSPRKNYMERIVAAARREKLPPDYIGELESWQETDG